MLRGEAVTSIQSYSRVFNMYVQMYRIQTECCSVDDAF